MSETGIKLHIDVYTCVQQYVNFSNWTHILHTCMYTHKHTHTHIHFSFQLTKCLSQRRKVKHFKSYLLPPFSSLFTTGGPMNSGNPGRSGSHFSQTHYRTWTGQKWQVLPASVHLPFFPLPILSGEYPVESGDAITSGIGEWGGNSPHK